MTGVTPAPGRGSHRPWLLRAPRNGRGRLFCLPYSGCGASMYRRWPEDIDGVEVCPIQLPARENRIREPHYQSFPALADQVVEGIARFLDRPYALFGHCAGALQAFEVAQRIHERGLPAPVRLFLSSQPPPNQPADTGFNAMSETELREELLRLLAGMGVTPSADLLELCLSVYRPDLEAARAYHHPRVVPLPVPATVIAWTSSGLEPSRLAGWSAYGPVRSVSLAGGHYDFLQAPPGLLEVLSRWY